MEFDRILIATGASVKCLPLGILSHGEAFYENPWLHGSAGLLWPQGATCLIWKR